MDTNTIKSPEIDHSDVISEYDYTDEASNIEEGYTPSKRSCLEECKVMARDQRNYVGCCIICLLLSFIAVCIYFIAMEVNYN
jgi:hypothetical protein